LSANLFGRCDPFLDPEQFINEGEIAHQHSIPAHSRIQTSATGCADLEIELQNAYAPPIQLRCSFPGR